MAERVFDRSERRSQGDHGERRGGIALGDDNVDVLDLILSPPKR
jgi:hypothetical protein